MANPANPYSTWGDFARPDTEWIQLAHSFCHRYKLPAKNIQPMHLGVNGTFRVGEKFVLRIAAPSITLAQLGAQVDTMRRLRRSGAPVARPTRHAQPLQDPTGAVASVWRYETTTTQPVDWHTIGRAVRTFHTAGEKILQTHRPDLPAAVDVTRFEQRIWKAHADSRLTAKQARFYLQVCAFVQRNLPKSTSPDVIVQGDLWPKNILQTARGPLLCDTDFLSIGPRAYDLTFIARNIPTAEVTSFEKGYGANLPPQRTVSALGLLHELNWALWVIDRRRSGPGLEKEAQRATPKLRSQWRALAA